MIGACWRGHLQIAHVLVANGASANDRNVDGDTALDLAREWSHGHVVAYLEGLLQQGTTIRNDPE